MDDKMKDRITAWRADPVLFVREELGAEPKPWQADTLRSLTTEKRLAVRTGHGPGKTALLAWSALWWVFTHAGARVACTGPTELVCDGLMDELLKWVPSGPLWDVEGKNILVGGPHANFITVRRSDPEKPEALQGFMGRHLLFLVDEPSGVPDIIFQCAKGTMMNGTVLLAGTPTRSEGYFFDAFTGGWWTRRVPGENREMAGTYGVGSDIYRSRVLGKFAA